MKPRSAWAPRHPSPLDTIRRAMDHDARLPGDPALMRYHVADDLIDQIAADVRQLARVLSSAQKARLKIIARELSRRVK